MEFDKLRKNIDEGLYDVKDGKSTRDFSDDVESAYGSEFMCLHPDVKSKVHYLAYEKGHSSGLLNVLNQYGDLIELTTCMLKTMVPNNL